VLLPAPVSAQQSEHLATLHGEPDTLDRLEAAEKTTQFVHLDHRRGLVLSTVIPAQAGIQCGGRRHSALGIAMESRHGIIAGHGLRIPIAMRRQQRHERVLEARRHGLPVFARLRQRLGILQHHAHAPGLHLRVDYARAAAQDLLQLPAPQRGMPHAVAMPDQWGMKCGGWLLRQELALVQQHDVVAQLGLIQIRRAHQHCHALRAHGLDDAPQLAPRDRIDTDRGLIQQQQTRRAQQCASQAQLLFHAAGQVASAAFAERPQRGQTQQFLETHAALRRVEALQIGIHARFSCTLRSSYKPKRCGM